MPNDASQVLDKNLKRGENVTLLEENSGNGYIKIKLNNGNIGYIKSTQLDIERQNQSSRQRTKLFSSPTDIPVRIIAPGMQYLEYTSAVKESIKGDLSTNVKTAIAQSGEEFKNLLINFTRDLENIAQKQADEEALKEFRKLQQEYAQKLQKYEEELKKIEEAYKKDMEKYKEELANIKENIKSVKSWVRGILTFLGVLTTAGTAALIWNNNRPVLNGYVVIDDKNYPIARPLPRRKRECHVNLGTEHGSHIFTPTRKGVMNAGKILNEGDQIKEGIYYTKHPALFLENRRNSDRGSSDKKNNKGGRRRRREKTSR